MSSGRPELVSPDSLPDFKRILTVADDDAALRIPAAARKEFVAVELQPGVAITVATARFAEKAQYATFIKDLGANDILVREEMIATDAVIAASSDQSNRRPNTAAADNTARTSGPNGANRRRTPSTNVRGTTASTDSDRRHEPSS